MNRILTVALAATAMFATSDLAMSAVLPFTFDPNAASPSLAGAGSAFTANGISLSSYLTAVVQPDFAFTTRQLLPVTGFTLDGAPVAAPGLAHVIHRTK